MSATSFPGTVLMDTTSLKTRGWCVQTCHDYTDRENDGIGEESAVIYNLFVGPLTASFWNKACDGFHITSLVLTLLSSSRAKTVFDRCFPDSHRGRTSAVVTHSSHIGPHKTRLRHYFQSKICCCRGKFCYIVINRVDICQIVKKTFKGFLQSYKRN